MGTKVRFDFDKSLQDTLLHSPSFVAGLPGVLGRAMAIKAAVDREKYAGTMPSIALNRLVATSDRMQVGGEGAKGGVTMVLVVTVVVVVTMMV